MVNCKNCGHPLIWDKSRWLHKNGRIFYRGGENGFYPRSVKCVHQWGASSQSSTCPCKVPVPHGWRNSWRKLSNKELAQERFDRNRKAVESYRKRHAFKKYLKERGL